MHLGFLAEVRRAEDGSVSALSLACTHTACNVEWKPAEGIYLCKCHEGVFDADGRVLSGPPERPLPAIPVRIEGDQVVVGEPAAG